MSLEIVSRNICLMSTCVFPALLSRPGKRNPLIDKFLLGVTGHSPSDADKN